MFVSKYLKKEDIKFIIYIILILGILVSLIGLYQLLAINKIPDSWLDSRLYSINVRVYSTFYNPNILAVFLNLVIITSVVTIINNIKKFNKTLAYVAILSSTLCHLFTYSRGGWISLVVALFILVFKDKKYLKYVLFFAFTFVLFDYFSGAHRLVIGNIQSDSSINYRFEIWKASIKIIRDYPLLGIGPGITWDYLPKYSEFIKAYVSHVHNIYLRVLVDIGFLGFLFFVLFIVEVWRILKFNIDEGSPIGEVCTISVAYYIVLLTNGLIDDVLSSSQISIYFWVLVGINYGVCKDNKQKYLTSWTKG